MDKNLFELAKAAAKRETINAFSVEQVEGALREQINKMFTGADGKRSAKLYEQNKYDVFELIQETADEIVPNRIIQIMGQFAEVQQVGQGNKATFRRKLGKQRGKSFITKVSPAGTYEAFRLDSDIIEVVTEAVGAAAIIDWERYLDGLDSMSDLVDIIMEGLEDAIYKAVYAQLIAAYSNVQMPTANKVAASGLDKKAMDRIISVVKSYGQDAVIFCTQLFAANFDNEIKGMYLNDKDKNEIREQGYVGVYKGTKLVILPMSVEDETNMTWAYDPSYAFILPTGNEKLVKVVLEGDLQIGDFKNRDWSIEMQFYKKYGVAMIHYNNWGIYKDTSLSIDVMSN